MISDLYWLTDKKMVWLQPFFPMCHGRPRLDDRRVLSGILFVNRNGLRWRDAPREYGLSAKGTARRRAWGKQGGRGRLIGRTKGGMDTKLHSVTDANGRPISFFMTAGQVSNYTGAAALLDGLPRAQWLLGDRGYDADWFRDTLQERGITPCILGRKSRTKPVKYDKRRYRSRNRIEIMFGRLKEVT